MIVSAPFAAIDNHLEMYKQEPSDWDKERFEFIYLSELHNITISYDTYLVNYSGRIHFQFKNTKTGSTYVMFPTELQEILDLGLDIRNLTGDFKIIKRSNSYGIKYVK